MQQSFIRIAGGFFHRNELFFSIVIFFLVIILFIFPLFSYSTIQAITEYGNDVIYKNALAQLKQTYNIADAILSSIVNDFYNYCNYDSDFFSVLHSSSISWEEVMEVTKQLRFKMNNNTLISSVYIFNSNFDKVFSIIPKYNYSGILPIEQFYDQDIVNRLGINNVSRNISFIPRHVNMNIHIKSVEEDYLSIVFSERALGKPFESALVVNISQSMLQQLLNGEQTAAGNVSFIVNTDGYIISHTNPERINRWAVDMEYVTSVLASQEKSGSQRLMIDGKQKLITFMRSNKYGIVFFQISDYTELTQALQKVNTSVIFYSIICFLICFIIAILSIRKIYIPLHQLLNNIRKKFDNTHVHPNLNEYEYLTAAYNTMQTSIDNLKYNAANAYVAKKKETVRMLLNGEFSTYDECLGSIRSCEIKMIYPFFQVIAFQFEGLEDFNENSTAQEMTLLRFTVSNIVNEIIGSEFQIIGEEENKDVSYFLINVPTEDNLIQDKLYKLAVQIQDTIKNHMWFSVSVYIGQLVNSLMDIWESKRQAMVAGKYRLIYGAGSIIKYTDIAERERTVYEYSYTSEVRVLDAIRQKNFKKCDLELDNFFSELEHASSDEMLFSAVQLSIIIARSLHMDDQKISMLNYRELNNELMKCNTIQEIKQYIKELVRERLDLYKKSELQHFHNIVKNIQKYIDENYHIQNLTVDDMAAYAQISPNYVRQLFREYLDKSPIDYLIDVRIQKAKELLVNTNEAASAIAYQVGYNDSRYFYYVFKKRTGYTTSQYREIMKKTLSSVEPVLDGG